MDYVSTRGEAPTLNFEEVLLAGLARDGGLYLPERWPTFEAATIASLAGRPFHEVAVEVIHPFVGTSVGREALSDMARAAYASFGHAAVTPLIQIDSNRFILELFHGPTLAFKDVAMQLLARLMDHVLQKRGSKATFVGATSGDTGGAAIEAFRGAANVDVFILFPEGRVSDVQRRMMTTPKEDNVHAIAVRGTFDDCQAQVKAMFNNHAFRDRVQLSGVNSINWARIVAQITYYFVAATALGAPFRRVSLAVPTGNFGDIFAGYAARRMGLPIERLVIASNENDILPRTLATGAYEMRGVTATTSPSMDIQISSNFERYLFEASGRDAGAVRRQMESLRQSKRFELDAKVAAAMGRDFLAVAASEAEVAASIRKVLAGSGYLVEPHTACGVHACERVLNGEDRSVPQVVLATAHPAKFPDAMEAITGTRPGLPERLHSLMNDPERFRVLDNDAAVIEAYVESNARAIGAGQ
ncbi:MAG: threonine synthase [Alphaproteobacteria bacterium]|nr:threonine synthase [Alphaproteobacteria bacterium]